MKETEESIYLYPLEEKSVKAVVGFEWMVASCELN